MPEQPSPNTWLEFLVNKGKYGFDVKVENLDVIPRNQVILEDDVVAGDKVSIFFLPDGKHLLSKDSKGLRIEKLTSAYVWFETEIQIKES